MGEKFANLPSRLLTLFYFRLEKNGWILKNCGKTRTQQYKNRFSIKLKQKERTLKKKIWMEDKMKKKQYKYNKYFDIWTTN